MTQVVLHLGIIFITVPCARPFLVVLESPGFRHPTTSHELVRRRSTRILHACGIPTNGQGGGLGIELTEILRRLPGAAGRRKRSERWKVSLGPIRGHTTTTVVHDADHAKRLRRAYSVGTLESRRAITRTASFSVEFLDGKFPSDERWDPV
ncbi:hypothetical protein Tdes44962_MAKER05093 [Teratosphaeria destructans]|uniref:Secreted protein n=1 Tax=Teratosphaeria destructans TaxID=418781 RepID=A0A9W7SKX8_9PEZI|nr:hypothetical protein Tdes44962_MAKER05093 [Teratosphaeria destructans]